MTHSDKPAAPTALTPLQRAFIALEDAQARLARMEQAAHEPIAVVGIGCRLPGGGDGAARFWNLLSDGVDAIGPVPADRWDADALYDPDPETPGRVATRSGGFIEAVDHFDPGFFSIAPREAQGMDPQQRLLLEVAWEALEHAGQAPDRLEGSRAGVFVAVCSSDYAYMQLKSGDKALLDAHFTSGIAHSVFSGRLSYLMGLQGPSVTIDTACSSSLVAVHLACQSLRSGESTLALAGGVNLMLSPDLFIALSHSRMLAPDGRCKTFDAAADGFSRAEGCGVVVLKRLSDAQADGDRILAMIRGSAVNQDGPSSSLTAPNGPAQEAVIREALRSAGVAPADVGFIEAHGTGTQLGDPLEVHALGAVFGPDRDPARPLLIGSVKTNIGHLEAAAGVTGLIKLVLSLHHRRIPRHLHFHTPNPHIAWGELPLRVPVQALDWEPIDGRRIGGVSSFGFSGTNAHIVVEEAPSVPSAPAHPARRAAHLLALSARDEKALSELAARYVAALEGRTDDALADVCFTANAGRAHFAQRATIIAHDIDELRDGLIALSRQEEHASLRAARVQRRDPPRVAFLFTGQGAQYAGMARVLYESAPAFRSALDRCAEKLAPKLTEPLLSVLFPAEGQVSPIDETAFTQPALFALEYSLCELWRSWGVTPNVVMGHSVGELAAACVAGVMTLDDALGLIAERGRLMQSLPAGGAMAAIHASEERVSKALAAHGDLAAVAAVNAPEQTVVSGAVEAVQRVCAELGAQGVRCTPLAVSHAFHSPLVDPVLDAFESEAARVRFGALRTRLISNLSGRVADAAEVTRPGYWRRHVREAVRFGDGLSTLAGLSPDCVIEIGPHPTLIGFAGAVFGNAAPVLIPSLRKGRDDWEQMQDALASLYLAGVQIDWRGVERGFARRVVDLPTYPFQRERFWFQAKRQPSASRGRATGHPILGTRLRSAASEVVFESQVGADAPAFVRQHRVQGHVVMPATAYLDTLLCAAAQWLGSEGAWVEDLTVQEAMLLKEDGATRTVQVVCGPPRDGALSASLSSAADGDDGDDAGAWVSHVTATLRTGASPRPADTSLTELRAQCVGKLDVASFYAGFAGRGIEFGERFRVVREIHVGAGQALGLVELTSDDARDAGAYRMHPVLLDGCLQTLAAVVGEESADSLFLPVGIGRYALLGRPGTRCFSHVSVQVGSPESRRADIRVFGENGAPLAELLDLQLKRVSRDALGRLGGRWLDDALFETRWDATATPSVPALPVPELARAASGALVDLRRAADLECYDAFLPRLESLCADYVVQAMTRLGWQPRVGEKVEASALAAGLRVAPRHRRLFGRLLTILGEAGYLAGGADAWTVLRGFPAVAPEAERARLAVEFPCGGVELEFTGRVAAAFAEALRGEIEPMELLFPGGSLETAERLYRDTPTARFYNGLMSEVVGAAAARRADRPLRILEIGAGTGGTTAHVVPRLAAANVEYTFTDVGPLFVARARERFGAHPFMRFQVFDLEREPQAQGLEPASFDFVIASNVIHATADLRRTLGRVRQLLVPGGALAMLEVTAAQRWFDLTVGLTEGWWAFTDNDLRPEYATMPRERWCALLAACGFDSVTALPEGDGLAGARALQSMLLARAAPSASAVAPRDWLLLTDDGGVVDSLAARLRARGDRCTLVRAGDAYAARDDEVAIRPGEAGDYRRLLSDLRASGRRLHGALCGWPLDAAAWDRMTPEALSRAQAAGTVSAMLLAQAAVAETPAPRLWFVSRGGQQCDVHDSPLAPAQAPIWGLGKAIALEHPELRCVCCDLDPAMPASEVDALSAELEEPGTESQVAWRNGERRVARLARLRSDSIVPVAHRPPAYRLAPSTTGSLDGFDLQPLDRRAPGHGEVEIAVEATGLNFKDVLNVLGMYPGNPGPLGGECAGRVVAVGPGVTRVRVGDDVMAVASGSFASHVIARSEFVQLRPAGMSAEEGASFPIPFVTAEFCLGHLARIQAGERVLIHAAAGGVGMAAVRLAQRAGADVFATAGSPAKRELLRAMGVRHVFDSRSAAFATGILSATNGDGVDVVLNSLSGELIEASFGVLSRGGRFVEIGKRGIKTPEWVESLDRALRYFVVDWGDAGEQDPALIGGMLERLVDDLGQGRLQTLPRHVFAIDETDRAFRFMAQARHHGKIVVRHRAHQPAAVRRDGTYLVTGGLSGLGPVVARWLAERGAGRLVLIGRRGATPDVAPALDLLRALGTTVVAESVDVSDGAALAALLARIRSEGPPLRGVVHSAGALDDASLLQQDPGRFARVFAAKVHGGYLLDTLTRGDSLDFFVLFSSIASVLGSRGQSNHSAANAFLDLLARERHSRGLPGLSINWGAWTDVGAAVQRGVTERIGALGLGALTPSQGLLAMERLLAQDRAQAAVLIVDWKQYLAQAGQGGPPAFLSAMASQSEPASAPARFAAPQSDLRQQIAAAVPARRRPLVAAFVREKALRALGLDPSRNVDPRTPLGEFGLDSLLAVELRNTLGSALGQSLSATLLFDYPTLDALTDFILDEVVAPAAPAAATPAGSTPADSLVDSIEDLSDEEVERMLAARAKRPS